MSKYKEKLKDPRWQKIRLKVLERDGFSCRICNNDKQTLAVHHKFYDKNKAPWDYLLESLLTLCEDCHEIFHKRSTDKEIFVFKVCDFDPIYSCEHAVMVRLCNSNGDGFLHVCGINEDCDKKIEFSLVEV